MTEEVERVLRELNQDLHRLYADRKFHEYAETLRNGIKYAHEHLEPHDPDLGSLYLNLADGELQLGNYAEGIRACEEAAVIFGESLGPTSCEYLLALNNWAELLARIGDYGTAEALFLEVARISRFAEFATTFATAQNNLGFLHTATGRFRTAEIRFRAALKVRRRFLGSEHPEIANSLNNLGDLFVRRADYAKAQSAYNEALRIRTTAANVDPGLQATSLNNMATLKAKLGDYQSAEQLYREAIEVLGVQPAPSLILETATCEENFAMLLGSMGRLRDAEEWCRKAYDRRSRVLPETHPDLSLSLSNLSRLRFAAGDYAAAIRLQTQALEARRNAQGNPLDIAVSLSALVEVYYAIGDLDRAESCCREALDIRLEILGENHPEATVSSTDLAAIRASRNDWDGAKSLLEGVVAHRSQLFGEMHPEVASALSNVASLLVNSGQLTDARPLLVRTLEIRRRCLGDQHPDTVRTLVKLGALSYERGEHTAARGHFETALDVLERLWGSRHPRVTEIVHRLAILDAAVGDHEASLARMLDAMSRDDAILDNVLSFGAEQQRIAFLDAIRRSLHRLLALVTKYFRDSRPAVRVAFDCVLRRKGITLTAAAAQRATLRGTHSGELSDLLEQQIAFESRITRALLDGPRGMDPAAHRQMVGEWIAGKERIEDRIAERAPGLLVTEHSRFDAQAVAAAIPRGAILAEFVRFPDLEFTVVPEAGATRGRPPRFAAFLLPSGAPDQVQLLDLGEAGPIDAAVEQFRAYLTSIAGHSRALVPSTPSSFDDQAGARLRTMLFDPLAACSPETKRWLISPDGAISSIPFDALPFADDEYLIDRYTVSYVSSGRDLVRTRTDSLPGPPLVVADPDFDLASTQHSEPVANEQEDAQSFMRDLRGSGLFPRLRGTYAEGNEIGQILGALPLMGSAALESAVRAAHSPSLLHLATHGFFLRDKPLRPKAFVEPLDPEEPLYGIENPLLRSGLALAGANSWLRGEPVPTEAEDGILTAQDVCALDLSGTQIAILSACDTALGDIHHGEGVFGLRRAFAIAGARTLIMSLWRVPDEETRELMVLFYTSLAGGCSPLEALRTAQAEIRKSHPEPYYWASFICEGDVENSVCPLLTF